jgi:hypothetical protein
MSEIESVKPILTVISDDGDFIINSTGPAGKAMAQAILPLLASAKRVMIVQDGEMKVMKRSGAIAEGARGQAAMAQQGPATVNSVAQRAAPHLPAGSLSDSASDIQDQFAADLEAGRTGEQAMGEVPSPTPGPNEPVKVPAAPAARRKPQIFQDAAAPPAPELAEAEMDRLLAEAAQAEADAVKVQEDRRFQSQQAVQANEEPVEAEVDAKPAPRKREPRQLATTGRVCGKCGGSGQTGVEDPSGRVFMGKCAVCRGEGQTQVFARGPKFR